MEFCVLGPVEVIGPSGSLAFPAKQRKLLAALLVRAGEVCSADHLVDAIWADAAPQSAHKLLQLYVSQARKTLTVPVINTRDRGYVLELAGHRMDSAHFEELFEEGAAALRDGNAVLAASLLRRALQLWRGRAYAGLADEEFAHAEAQRLENLRLTALEHCFDAELALGAHREIIAGLQSVAGAHPFHEHLQAQLMLALYRSGRQADALAHYSATRDRLREELGLEPGAELRDLQKLILGNHPTLANSESDDTTGGSLPIPPNKLLGRDREVSDLREMLLREDIRLLVLTGAGGSGKTRLALAVASELASEFANGAVLVELAPLLTPEDVHSAIARQLGLSQAPGQPFEVVAATLRSRELLLVLDNAEHIRAVGPELADLLARAPRLKVLVTSRVILRVRGEHVYPVEPLQEQGAVALFLERAADGGAALRADDHDMRAIDEICRRVDRLPLAIELAASYAHIVAPTDLLARLGTRLPLLSAGPRDLPARQNTMRATIEWSFSLLDSIQRKDLASLSVFADGFTLSAAEAVCGVGIERLSALAEHSLVRRHTTATGSRYRILETIREYAAEELRASGEADIIARRNLEHLIAVAEAANLSAEAEGPQDFGAVLPEHANARAAIEHALTSGEIESALKLCVALENFWVTRNPFEGVDLFTRLFRDSSHIPRALRARALRAFGSSAHLAGQPERAKCLFEESLAVFEALRDEQGVAVLTYRLGYIALELQHLHEARPLLEQSLQAFRKTGSRRGQAQAIGALGAVAHGEGNLGLAASLYAQSAELAEQIGRTWWQERMLLKLADLAWEQGHGADVATWAREALRLASRIKDRQTVIYAVAHLSSVAAARGDAAGAGRLWGAIEAEQARASLGVWEADRRVYEDRIRVVAGPTFAAAVEEGTKLALDQVILDLLASGEKGSGPGM